MYISPFKILLSELPYVHDWLLYLPEFDTFDEGGYKPGWAVALNILRNFQQRVWKLIEPGLMAHAP